MICSVVVVRACVRVFVIEWVCLIIILMLLVFMHISILRKRRTQSCPRWFVCAMDENANRRWCWELKLNYEFQPRTNPFELLYLRANERPYALFCYWLFCYLFGLCVDRPVITTTFMVFPLNEGNDVYFVVSLSKSQSFLFIGESNEDRSIKPKKTHLRKLFINIR